MKSGELPKLNQPRDDHFDINVRRMMAQVDQAECFWSKFTGAVIAGSPIVDNRRIKGRFIKLVLHKHSPVAGERGVNLAHALEVTVQRMTEVLLAGEIAAIGNPDGVRFGAQRLSDLNAFDIVC